MTEHVNLRAVIGGNDPPLGERLALDEAALVAEVEAMAERANKLPRKLVDATADTDIGAIGVVVRDVIALNKRIETRRVIVKAPWLEGERAVDNFFGPLSTRLSRVAVAFERLVRDYREDKRVRDARAAAEEARKRQAEEAERRKAAEEAARKGRERTAALESQKAEEAAQAAREAQDRAAVAAANAAPPPQTVKAEVAPDLTMATKGVWVGEIADVRTLDLEVLRPYLSLKSLETALNQAVTKGVRECRGAKIALVEKVSFK